MTVAFDLWGLIVFGLGFWMMMDGLVFGVIPETMSRLMRQIQNATQQDLRNAGIVCLLAGAAIVFLSVRFASGW